MVGMRKVFSAVFLLVVFLSAPGWLGVNAVACWAADYSMSIPTQNYLTIEECELLEEMFATHLNFFLSSEVITLSGLPATAYKVGNRSRYDWSNPTEWGYVLQAWIAGAERGLISQGQALSKIEVTLNTLEVLQGDPNQSFDGLFYPYYRVISPSTGVDLAIPYHDSNLEIPSGDNALLYASLVITEGWAKLIGAASTETKARSVKDKMGFRMFLTADGDDLYLAHTKHAVTGTLSGARWDVYADEGGVVTWIALLSGSVTPSEFAMLTESQWRQPASWTSCASGVYTVQEATWFNAMFAWSVRSLAGFPIGDYDSPNGYRSLYGLNSLVPNAAGHLAYSDCLGFDYPAFSDAMTQSEGGSGLVGWVQGWYIPPNLPDLVGNTPDHVMPHALFIPFTAGPDLADSHRARLIQGIAEMRNDLANYYHDTGPQPFGFEVITSPHRNDLTYDGADEGRLVFETLSQSYILLSVFSALQVDDSQPTFYDIAANVSGYADRVRDALEYLYPQTAAVFRIEGTTGNVLADGSFYGVSFQTGAADVAEWVRISAPVDKGDVLELDPLNPGSYRKSLSPCSALVAGVVSTNPGVILGGRGLAGEALLALAGVVPVKVTDEGGRILPGDLLVASSTPGHAMRWADPGPCPCALIGKALGALTAERGVIMALLSSH